jgi:hypothetical protein
VVAERNLVAAELVGDAVQDAAAQARAQRARGFAFRDQALDDAVRILVFDVVIDAELVEVCRQDSGRKIRLRLVEVDGNDVEVDRRAFTQRQQDVQQRVAVLPYVHTVSRHRSICATR